MAVTAPPVQTIEKTGKNWKAVQLVGVGIMVVGMLVAGSSPMNPLVLRTGIGIAAFGMVLHLTARTGAWWDHG